MSTTGVDTFEHATHTARVWLAEVARHLDTKDEHAAYRMLRAWLHTLRDRLPTNSAADFAAQLPEIFRGVYYDGWQPNQTPVKFGPDEYRRRFAREAQIRAEDVDAAACRVTAALRIRMSPGHLDHTLDLIAHPLRMIMQGPAPAADSVHLQPTPAGLRPAANAGSVEARVAALEQQIAVLAEAVQILAHGLESHPSQEPDARRGSDAARRAHELLMAPS